MTQPVSTPQAPISSTATPASSYSTSPVPIPRNSAPNYLLVVVLTALVLVIGYQQMQITRLSADISVVSGDVRSGETRGRLEALEARQQEMNTRLTYIDSKITATDEKAQAAMNRIKLNEEKADWFGNILRSIGWK